MNPRELESLILLNRLLLSSRQPAWALLEQGHAASHIVTMIEEENLFDKAEALKKIRLSFDAISDVEAFLPGGASIITMGDKIYPSWLKTIIDPLWVIRESPRVRQAS